MNTTRIYRLSVYEQKRWDLVSLMAGTIYTPDILEWVDEQVQAAFQRGIGVTKSGGECDAVSLAQQAGITSPDTLSNLYSREWGFKP